MKKKQVQISKTVGIGAATAVIGIAAGSFFCSATSHGKPIEVPNYSIERVVDGDTFVTAEKQIIRLAAVNAPEIDRCGGPEAKRALEKMIMNKPVYLKVIFNDKFHRLVSLVYTKDTFINKEMLKGGYAYVIGDSATNGELQKTGEGAREKKIGIFSTRCTQQKNSKKPSCNIKGNDSRYGKFYFLPECGTYDQAVVQLYLGDRWFCTEQEAKKAGFRPPSQCP